MDDVLPSLLDLNGEELYVLLTLYDHPDRPIIPDIRFNLASLADQTLRRNSALIVADDENMSDDLDIDDASLSLTVKRRH
ncbi:hypothetical protein PC118_g10282 [Phytophthora cactorum]|uniref:Uncharacterized protein n=1 Tax=Phytophthora cactorum TaxID=29920 RepID=A0A8T1FTI0_9STRA|nr:hypothetical protein PC118_g10282 [Phytophthora cactorum]